MEIRAFTSYFTVIGLMLATSLALAFSVDVKISDVAGVKTTLPDHVGRWVGEDILFCQEPKCQKTVSVKDIKEEGKCPSCGGKLETMSLVERQLLPADTVLLKKRYVSDRGEVCFASLVLSGKERASIHRPEVCLVGQGTEIIDSGIMSVDLPSRKPLDVKVLNLNHVAPGSPPRVWGSYYAYWFVGNQRETPYHWQRMMWMASDRILHNVSHRWAYIAVSGARDLKTDAHREQATELIRGLYPQIAL